MLPSWSPFFQAKVRMQGRAAQMAGKVTRRSPENDQLLAVDVTDDDGTHTVTVEADGRQGVAECTCDTYADGQFCPHIWAAVLDLAHGDEPAEGTATIADLAKLKPRPPKARKREPGVVQETKRGEPRWMSRLTLLQPGAQAERARTRAMDALANAQRQVCYVVLPGPSRRSRAMVVELQQRSAIATGWSKPRPLKLSSDNLDTLGDPVDRELAALLLGAGRVAQDEPVRLPRGLTQHATYRLVAGAQRALLRRMIDTGRCFVNIADEDLDEQVLRPLRWELDADAPLAESGHAHSSEDHALGAPTGSGLRPGRVSTWVPWLVGRPAAGALRLEMQLRRDGRRVPATSPLLVLGGPDGVVIFAEPLDRRRRRQTVAVAARFDDREALAWVQQFRDSRFADDAEREGLEETEDDAPGTMLVPDEQVAGFLERLYLLPQLPELDLPDGLGYREQRIEPRPVLELFSPGTAQAAELGATQKSQLAGRIRFDYAGVRVSPTQPGRFVPVAAGVESESAGVSTSDEEEGGLADAEEMQTLLSSTDTNTDTDTTPATAVLDAVETETHGDEGEARRLIRRNFRAEREAIEQTAGLGLRSSSAATPEALLLPSKHVPVAVSRLLLHGWAVFADQKLMRTAGPPALSISSGIDWFELRGDVKFTDDEGAEHVVALPAILEAARAGRQMIELDDGTQGLLPEQWLAEHGLLTAMGELHSDHLRFRTSQAAMLDTLLDEQDLQRVDDPFREAREALRGFDGIHPAQPHPDFHGTLRTYQQHGLGWFAFLRRFGMGGVLADDMGLGKTVQVLAMLQQRVHERGDQSQPSLIVAPRSVVFNWLDESEKFTPELKVLAYTGPDRTQFVDKLEDYDLIVTSYGLMRRDAERLADVTFDYAVLDEAQAIKNPSSQSAKAARLLNANHRLSLTGTPVENHLGDLWSIFEYLNPGMLGANARFADLVRGATANIDADQLGPDSPPSLEPTTPSAEEQREEAPDQTENRTHPDVVDAASQHEAPDTLDNRQSETGNQKASPLHQLAAALRPFILRRTKAQVLTDLPAKTEQTIHCEMEPAQRKVYDELRTYYRGTLINQLDADGVTAGKSLGRSTFMVLEALLRLRQAACHPALIDKAGINTTGAPSAKLDALLEMLSEVLAEGQKALVFSQFTSMLSLVRQRFDESGIQYAYLDGQTRNRRQVVEDFQTDPDLQVFLISLKAGGVGLNLTAAEYVFILDPWWNPAVEQQAIDRTHRIGQTKPVFAYRMICEDTVEQRILELQKRKRNLAEAIVGGEENVLSSLTRDDLEALLA